MKNIVLLAAILVTIKVSSFGQENFQCPMKKGKIIIEHRKYDNDKKNPGAVIESKKNLVYSTSNGFIKGIDTAGDVKRVHVEFGNYFFSYINLGSINVKIGQAINKGDPIGEVKKGERLFLICSKDDVFIDPQRILKCRVVNRYLD